MLLEMSFKGFSLEFLGFFGAWTVDCIQNEMKKMKEWNEKHVNFCDLQLKDFISTSSTAISGNPRVR